MNVRPLCTLTAVGALLASILSTGAASAQERDGVRFRGGVGLEVGAIVAPGAGLGVIGVQGQLGAQITNQWAVYAVPTLDIAFAHGTGLAVGFGAMADYTFSSIPLGVAAGPETGVFAALGGGGAAAGALYGVRLRGAYYPILTRGENGIRRKALAVGLDLRLDGGGAAFAGAGGSIGSAYLISPVAFVGYQAF
jgi:hypothetical protein